MNSIPDSKEFEILSSLSENGFVRKTDLFPLLKNWYTLDRVLESLEKKGLIHIEEKRLGRVQYEISITPKGRSVAEQLKKAEDVAEGKVEISEEDVKNWEEDWKEKTKHLSLLFHVNVFEDHITIGEEKHGKLSVRMVYVRMNGNGIMRLWCEDDEAYDCIHVQYAWTLPKVQEMYFEQVRKGNIK